jgi:hypothetical protein
VLTVLVASAGLAVFVLLRDGAGSSTANRWPADVSPLVDFVEEERGLAFTEPVPVEFLSVAEFRKEVQSEKGELTRQDRREIEQTTGLLRAVGLIEGDVDLFDAGNDLAGAGVLGFYSHEDKLIRIRGAELTPAVKATLVHELTHALQDQHFDLGARIEAFEKAEKAGDDTSAQSAFRALVEGDASRIESAYRDDMSSDEKDALAEEEDASLERYRRETRDVPGVLATMMTAPYTLGEAMLELAIVIDGNEAADELFRKPPTTDEHLLDPWTLTVDHDRRLQVTEPDVGPDGREFDSGEFGALMWLLVLAQRTSLIEALDAADGWGGDSYIAFEQDGLSCVRARYRGDTARDRTQMQEALSRWVAAGPGSTASVQRKGQDLVFESCDPGSGAKVGRDASGDALGLALMRTQLAVALVDGAIEEHVVRCYADSLVHAFGTEEFSDPSFDAGQPAVQRKMQRLLLSCA